VDSNRIKTGKHGFAKDHLTVNHLREQFTVHHLEQNLGSNPPTAEQASGGNAPAQNQAGSGSQQHSGGNTSQKKD
jgi:hypothetical protein